MRVLIVEDNTNLTELLTRRLKSNGYDVDAAVTLREAEGAIAKGWPDVVLLDANFPSHDGARPDFHAQEILNLLSVPNQPVPTVILMSGEESTAYHFREVRAWLNTGRIADILTKNTDGKWDFLTEVLINRVEILLSRRFVVSLEDEEKNEHWLLRQGIVSRDEGMLRIAQKIRRIVNRTHNSTSVLITGPAGSGKTLIARALHAEMKLKANRDLPFIQVRCGTLVSASAAKELLGFVSSSSADPDAVGFLDRAGEGVLLLDDIHLLPVGVYRGLLGALQEVDSLQERADNPMQFRARLVTTGVSLDELERQGQMPDELYNRIAGSSIVIPPLAQRPRDIEPLMKHFISRQVRLAPNAPNGFQRDVVRAFESYGWPGDVAQLKNIVGEIGSQVPAEMVTMDSLRELDLRYRGNPIEWDSFLDSQTDVDFLLYRLGWLEGWDSICEADGKRVEAWLRELFPKRADFIRDLCHVIVARTFPKPIDYLKALLFFGLVDRNRAQQAEVMKVLGLEWEPTFSLLSFLAGVENDAQGLHPAPLRRGWQGSRWVYVLGPELMGAKMVAPSGADVKLE